MSIAQAQPKPECHDTHNDERHQARCQKKLEIVMQVKNLRIGSMAQTFVKQTEVDRTAVPKRTHDTDSQLQTYDAIEHAIHDVRQLTRQSANIGREYRG